MKYCRYCSNCITCEDCYYCEAREITLSSEQIHRSTTCSEFHLSLCMIYPEDTFDKMYGKWDVPVTPEGLTACIEEFVRTKEAV